MGALARREMVSSVVSQRRIRAVKSFRGVRRCLPHCFAKKWRTLRRHQYADPPQHRHSAPQTHRVAFGVCALSPLLRQSASKHRRIVWRLHSFPVVETNSFESRPEGVCCLVCVCIRVFGHPDSCLFSVWGI